MKVLDEEPYLWFLLEHDGAMLLNMNCQYGIAAYGYMIQLQEKELAKYAELGHDYLTTLAIQVNRSAPIAQGSKSIYLGRDVSQEYADLSLEAIKEWKKR